MSVHKRDGDAVAPGSLSDLTVGPFFPGLLANPVAIGPTATKSPGAVPSVPANGTAVSSPVGNRLIVSVSAPAAAAVSVNAQVLPAATLAASSAPAAPSAQSAVPAQAATTGKAQLSASLSAVPATTPVLPAEVAPSRTAPSVSASSAIAAKTTATSSIAVSVVPSATSPTGAIPLASAPTLAVVAPLGSAATLTTTPAPARSPAIATPAANPAAVSTAVKAFYVAVNGNDHWSGRLAAPNAAGTDGPFATLAKAQSAMRASSDTHTTYVEGGDYYLTQSLDLTAKDNGESWLAYQGQAAVLHGGQQITGWSSSSSGVWTAKAPANAFPSGGGTGDLFLNGVRETHARYPNASPTSPVTGGWLAAANSLPGQNTYRAIQFKAGDIPQLSSTSGLYVSVFGQNGWSNSVLPVASINYKTDTITLASDAEYQIGAGSRYFLFNAPSLLDATGEWFYNPSGNTVSFKAPSGFTGGGVTAGSLDHVISVANASNITIGGLTLTDTVSTGTGLSLNNATGVTVTGVTIANTGVGIHVSGNSTKDQIYGSEIRNTDQSGIRLDPGSGFVTVSGNWIHDVGQLDTTGSGIWFTGASDDSFTHNLIQNTAAFGIGGGSVVGASDASFRDVISYNQISNANMQNADGGGIMITGQQQSLTNDIVSFNDIGHTLATGTGDQPQLQFLPPADLVSFGIYLDDYASGVQVTDNVIHDGIGGILIHSGWNNTVSNNVLTGNSGIAIEAQASNWQGAGSQPMANNTFAHNIVVLSQAGSTAAALVDAASGAASWDSNLYSGSALGSSSFMISGANEYLYDLAHWQQKGAAFDPHSVTGATGFVGGSVTPGASSAAASLGINPIQTAGIGLAGYQSQSAYS